MVFGKRIDLISLFGVTLRLDPSWFVVAVLISWWLADSSFPALHPGLATSTYWIMGITGSFGLFGSVVLHELGHALVARRFGLSIRGITLFFFGGIAEMDSEPPNALAEFMVAIAGPAVSFVIGVGCAFINFFALSGSDFSAVGGVVGYLAFINIVLVAFNMMPAFPLDGGRILRSVLWAWKNDLRWATSVTSRIGSGFGILLIALGVFQIIGQNNLVGGIWTLLIGVFIRNAARTSYRQLLLRRSLEGEPVARFMQTEVVAVPRSISVSDLVENFVYKYHYKLFPVVDEGRLVGCISTQQIKELPRSEWERQSVGAISTPCSELNTIGPHHDATEALSRMSRTGLSRLMVVDKGHLVGIITLKDLLRFLALKVELEGPDRRLTGSN
jgi:Zn-dependent protease/predicted transcriptional regulator